MSMPRLRASGTLLDTQVQVDAEGEEANLKATARLTPFAPVPLAQLNADVAHFNPAAWIDGAPSMRLRGQADLKPVSDAAGFSLEGPFSIENLDAGPVDKQRIPVRSARGSLKWSVATLTLALERVEGARGIASGALTWSQADGVDAKLTLNNIDASSIYSTATPTRIGGTLDYSLVGQAQRFTGTLRNQQGIELTADFNLLLRDQILAIETARVRLADGQASLSGRVELRGNYAARVKGTFENLDLARLVKGLDTSLNGQIDLDAQFRPSITGRADVTLANSRLMGRPLDGRATIALANQRLDADVNVTSQSARLTAQGGLGAGRTLTFEFAAPKLAEIVPQISGSITASGTLSGDYSAPQLQMDATASNLRLPAGQTIESASASIAAGAAPSAPLALTVKVSGHRGPDPAASLQGAVLTGRGTTADHTIELVGTTMTKQPVRIVAAGGWQQAADAKGAWRGSLVAAESGRPLELRLREPAPLMVSLGALSFGPARFEARDTHIQSGRSSTGRSPLAHVGHF